MDSHLIRQNACMLLRGVLGYWRDVRSRLPSNNPLRERVEPYFDGYYKRFPILCYERDTAVIHLFRCFEEALRLQSADPLSEGGARRLFGAIRWAHEALPWALRWIWSECPQGGQGNLAVDWRAFEDAGNLLKYGVHYYHLQRVFVLYSRNHFAAAYDPRERVTTFSFVSRDAQLRDAVRQLFENDRDANHRLSPELWTFIVANTPVIRTILPHYLEKIDSLNVRYESSPDITAIFQRWAFLQCRQMRFELPDEWNLGAYTLAHFRLFWRTLLCACLIHWYVHLLCDRSVGTRRGAIGSALIHVDRSELPKLGGIAGIPEAACSDLIADLTYNPAEFYWDPIWQPLIPLGDGSYIISPALVLTSSPERNLIVLLNRIPSKRRLYSTVSTSKEGQQLDELEVLFPRERYLCQRGFAFLALTGMRSAMSIFWCLTMRSGPAF